MFLEELADLKDRYPDRLQLVHVLSREAQEAELLTGRLDAERLRRLLAALLPPATSTSGSSAGRSGWSWAPARCCSRPASTRAHVHTELFHVEGEARAGAGRRAEQARAAGTQHGAWRPSTAGPRPCRCRAPGSGCWTRRCAVRADAPYACKGGVCGTCRASWSPARCDGPQLRAGADEVAAGYVLACQSQPVTDEVELDFDA